MSEIRVLRCNEDAVAEMLTLMPSPSLKEYYWKLLEMEYNSKPDYLGLKNCLVESLE